MQTCDREREERAHRIQEQGHWNHAENAAEHVSELLTEIRDAMPTIAGLLTEIRDAVVGAAPAGGSRVDKVPSDPSGPVSIKVDPDEAVAAALRPADLEGGHTAVPKEFVEGTTLVRDPMTDFVRNEIAKALAPVESRVKSIRADLGSAAEIARARERRVDEIEDRVATMETAGEDPNASATAAGVDELDQRVTKLEAAKSPTETEFIKALARIEHLESWARMAPGKERE